MNILSLDLSTKSTGYAIGNNQQQLLKYGCITASSKEPIARIIKIQKQIKQLIQNYKIDIIIMQQVRPQFNSHTNKILMWMQAATVIGAYEINSKIQFIFINPSQWRAALKIKQGRGVKRQILKQQDINYVKDKYNINVNDDEADAICLFDAYFIKFDNEINWE